MAMTLSTFKEVAELFSQTIAEIQADEAAQKNGARRSAIHVVAGPLKN